MKDFAQIQDGVLLVTPVRDRMHMKHKKYDFKCDKLQFIYQYAI